MRTGIGTRARLGVMVALIAWQGAAFLHGQATQPAEAPEPELRPVEVRMDQPQTMRLYIGQSRLISAPWPVARIAVDQPEVLEIEMLAPDRVQVQARSAGMTELTMWSEDEEVAQVEVAVTADLRGLQSQLARLFPRSTLELEQVQDVIVISGLLAGAEESAQLRQFIQALRLNALDMTRLAGVQQVQLQVRVAEVSRNALNVLNVNWFHDAGNWFGGNQLGSAAGPFVPMSVGIPEGHVMDRGRIPFTVAEGGIGVPPSATLFAGFPRADLEIFIQALAENQYLRLLAEPNLVALSGEEASFLAGGEFPIPVVQGAGAAATVSVEFKEFGVRLAFRPTVLGDGRIRLLVAPEVSELSDVGAVEIQGFRIPAVVTRRVQTTIEMNSGQTFGMAGLISRTSSARITRVPGLGSLPILGTLFRSTRYSRGETELIVLVTATLVEPLSAGPNVPVPGVQHQPPSPWEFYIQGRIEGRSAAKLGESHIEHLEHLGLHRLRGPGTWARYDGR